MNSGRGGGVCNTLGTGLRLVKKNKNKKRVEGEGALRDATFVTGEKSVAVLKVHIQCPRVFVVRLV